MIKKSVHVDPCRSAPLVKLCAPHAGAKQEVGRLPETRVSQQHGALRSCSVKCMPA